MRKLRTFGVIAAMTAAAAIPFAGSGLAGAQDAGDCGEGGVAASGTQTNAGGLLGAVAPIITQSVVPANAPVSSPNAQNCNANEVEVGGGGGGGGGHKGGGGSGGGGGHTGGGGGGVGGSSPAVAVGGAPRFAG
jgi:hypothetical protein